MSGVRARHSTWPALFVSIAVLAQIVYPLSPATSRPQLTGVIVVAAAAALVQALATAGRRGLATALSSAPAAAAFWGRPAVAAWGLLAMGPVAVAAVLREGRPDVSRASLAATDGGRSRRHPARIG